TFRAGATEASTIARDLPGISAADLMALGRFEVAARVGTGAGSAVSVVTGRTELLPPKTGQAEAIRDRSALAYGSVPSKPSADHEEQPSAPDDGDLVGARRRQTRVRWLVRSRRSRPPRTRLTVRVPGLLRQRKTSACVSACHLASSKPSPSSSPTVTAGRLKPSAASER